MEEDVAATECCDFSGVWRKKEVGRVAKGWASGKETAILNCGARGFCSQWGREGASFTAQRGQPSTCSRGVQPARVPLPSASSVSPAASPNGIKSHRYGWILSVQPRDNVQNYGTVAILCYPGGRRCSPMLCICVCVSTQTYHKSTNWLPKGCYCPHAWLPPPSFFKFPLCLINNFTACIISPWAFEFVFIMLKIFSQPGAERVHKPWPANNYMSSVRSVKAEACLTSCFSIEA